ncbi:unannotated protein [freshwater metagenome]|uniref:Unannotated protein n=1 Tax=freshwater metagenome TaxID=449393 RepID=A0A6J6XN39_9ZZZZ
MPSGRTACWTAGVVSGILHLAEQTPPTPYGPSTALPDEQFNLYTHCGINGAMIHGVWWQATTPLSDGNGNPPPGWGNPSEDGVPHFLDSGSVVSRMSNPDLTVKLERITSTDYPFRCS